MIWQKICGRKDSISDRAKTYITIPRNFSYAGSTEQPLSGRLTGLFKLGSFYTAGQMNLVKTEVAVTSGSEAGRDERPG